MDGSQFVGTSLDSPITRFAFPLLFERAGVIDEVCGTGVIVGAHLAITARHVIDELGTPPEKDAQLFGYSRLDAAGRIMRFRVSRIWTMINVDLAVLLLEVESGFENHVWDLPQIELLPPAVGERVCGFGYPRTAVTPPTDGTITVQLDASTTDGRVTQVHPVYRDATLMPFPCFETNMRCDPGMSGGPVMNAAGKLCGIFARAFEFDQSELGHTSTISLLWPLMAMLVDFPWPQRFAAGEEFPLLEAARAGIIGVSNLDRVVVQTGPNRTGVISLRSE